jgi:hypothetical protein
MDLALIIRNYLTSLRQILYIVIATFINDIKLVLIWILIILMTPTI